MSSYQQIIYDVKVCINLIESRQEKKLLTYTYLYFFILA